MTHYSVTIMFFWPGMTCWIKLCWIGKQNSLLLLVSLCPSMKHPPAQYVCFFYFKRQFSLAPALHSSAYWFYGTDILNKLVMNRVYYVDKNIGTLPNCCIVENYRLTAQQGLISRRDSPVQVLCDLKSVCVGFLWCFWFPPTVTQDFHRHA